MHKDLILTDVRLEDSVLSLEGEDKRLFVGFIKEDAPMVARRQEDSQGAP
jgi:hypothetical protein